MVVGALGDPAPAVDGQREFAYQAVDDHLDGVLEVAIEADVLLVSVRGLIVAEHTLHPGRHQIIEDPGHVKDFLEGARKSAVAGSCGIRRPLSHCAAAAGGA